MAALQRYGLVGTTMMVIAVARDGLMEWELIAALALPQIRILPLLHALEVCGCLPCSLTRLLTCTHKT